MQNPKTDGRVVLIILWSGDSDLEIQETDDRYSYNQNKNTVFCEVQ